jgi:nucleoside-diphosphate-sugar epimerase
VGSGKNVTIREFVETIQKLSENSVTKLKFGALPFRKNEVMESKVDLRALQALGWEPKVSLSEGLARTIQVERDRTN